MTLTLTLASGEQHSYQVTRLPKHWKSWLLRKLPYGTDTVGATFSRTR